MAAICATSIRFCRLRVTRLDALGNVADPPNNVYVTSKGISLQFTPVVTEGEDRELRSGCDTIIASSSGRDTLKRFDMEAQLGAFEPAMLEMMLGSSIILDGSDPVGVWWPKFEEGDTQTGVAVEAWSDAWVDDALDADRPYIHWLWPQVKWTLGQATLNTDFMSLPVTGKSSSNPNWGIGPHGDQPEEVVGLGGAWATATTPPDSACGYDDVAAGS